MECSLLGKIKHLFGGQTLIDVPVTDMETISDSVESEMFGNSLLAITMDNDRFFRFELVEEIVLVHLSSILHNDLTEILDLLLGEPVRDDGEVSLLEDLRPDGGSLSLLVLFDIEFREISLFRLLLLLEE